MAVSSELHKFFSALKACENYAKSLQRLSDAINEINSRLGSMDETAKALVLLFDGNIPSEILEKINSNQMEIQGIAEKISAINESAIPKMAQTFAEVRNATFSTENGEPLPKFIKDMTEPLTIFGDDSQETACEKTPKGNPVILRSINGGIYKCKSVNPTKASELDATLGNIVGLLEKVKANS
jgi:prefoldin subunit 5